ncbi:hypothetical protein GCM10009551_054240 [Nocardiopsis tropica]|uniref:hypothetical protein n=1 Tax=Tsukamurella strandjordii TaxID=147577 RepID=UPI0031E41FDF
MTENYAAKYTATINGRTVAVVGYLPASPRHPSRGTVVEQVPEAGDYQAAADAGDLYALVSVDWFTQVTTHDLKTGRSAARMVPGIGQLTGPGRPERTWYLTPVDYRDGTATIRGGLGRGHHDATLSASLVADGCPEAVPVHDFPAY